MVAQQGGTVSASRSLFVLFVFMPQIKPAFHCFRVSSSAICVPSFPSPSFHSFCYHPHGSMDSPSTDAPQQRDPGSASPTSSGPLQTLNSSLKRIRLEENAGDAMTRSDSYDKEWVSAFSMQGRNDSIPLSPTHQKLGTIPLQLYRQSVLTKVDIQLCSCRMRSTLGSWTTPRQPQHQSRKLAKRYGPALWSKRVLIAEDKASADPNFRPFSIVGSIVERRS